MTSELRELTGIYGLRETARYLANTPPLTNGNAIHINKLRYWIATSVPSIQGVTHIPSRQRLITFLDLISMRMVVVLRSRRIPLQNIRNTESWLRKEFNVPFPLATKSLWTYGGQIYIKFHEHILAASKFGQRAMEFIDNWLKEVDLDMTFNVAENADSWLVHKNVRINPTIQLGEPCIDGTRIPTSIVWSKHKAGDSIEMIARSHNLQEQQVADAVEWEKRLVAT